MTEMDEDNVEIHVEKESDDEEIQARNEISLAVNDYTSEYNRNKQITLKSKNKDVDELIKIAINALKTNFYELSGKKEKKESGHFG